MENHSISPAKNIVGQKTLSAFFFILPFLYLVYPGFVLGICIFCNLQCVLLMIKDSEESHNKKKNLSLLLLLADNEKTFFHPTVFQA